MTEQEYDHEPGGTVIPMPGFDVVPYDEDEYLPVPTRAAAIITTNVVDAKVIPGRDDVAVWVAQCREGIAWRRHKWSVHLTHSPLYYGRALQNLPRGLLIIVMRWWEWASDQEGLAARRAVHPSADPKLQTAYAKADELHRRRMVWRGAGSWVLLGVLGLGGRFALTHYPPALTVLAVLALLALVGWYGSPPGTITRIDVTAPAGGVPNAADIIEAFDDAKITNAMHPKKPTAVQVVSMPHRVGTGWTADVHLPKGVSVRMVMRQFDELASGLMLASEECLEIDPLPTITGRIRLFGAMVHPLEQEVAPWALLDADRFNVFQPLPVGQDARGNPVTLMLMFVHTLIGSLSQRGKTALMRMICCAVMLDRHADLIIVDFMGGRDFAPFEPYCLHFISGGTSAEVAQFVELLDWVEAEAARRMKVIKAADEDDVPDGRITEGMARKGMRPIIIPVDEFQVATLASKELVERWAELKRVVLKTGIVFVDATQTADDAVPTSLRNQSGQRVALSLPTWQSSKAVLGDDAHALGLDASKLGGRPGYGIVYGLDLPDRPAHRGRVRFAHVTNTDARSLMSRIGPTRKMPRQPQVETTAQDVSDVPKVVLAVLDAWPEGQDRAHLDDLAARLGIDKLLISGTLRTLGLDVNRNCKIRGVNRAGYELADVEALAFGGAR